MDNSVIFDGFPWDNKHFSVTPTYTKAGDAPGDVSHIYGPGSWQLGNFGL